jgi:hypothetical protein
MLPRAGPMSDSGSAGSYADFRMFSIGTVQPRLVAFISSTSSSIYKKVNID